MNLKVSLAFFNRHTNNHFVHFQTKLLGLVLGIIIIKPIGLLEENSFRLKLAFVH